MFLLYRNKVDFLDKILDGFIKKFLGLKDLQSGRELKAMKMYEMEFLK